MLLIQWGSNLQPPHHQLNVHKKQQHKSAYFYLLMLYIKFQDPSTNHSCPSASVTNGQTDGGTGLNQYAPAEKQGGRKTFFTIPGSIAVSSRSKGHKLESQLSQVTFMKIDQEINSLATLPLPLIQEGRLSVTGKNMCTNYEVLVNCLEN